MKVVVTYNVPVSDIPEEYVCHEGVMDQVRDVTNALAQLGCSFEVMSIGEDIRQELASLARSDADLIFNLCESIKGRSALQPCFAGYLELLDIPFTGASSAAITTAIDKCQTKAILAAAGIDTPQSWRAASLLSDGALRITEKTAANLSLPVIVKPAREDGSIGIDQSSVATTEAELETALERAIGRFGADNVLIEKFIEGREFYVGFLGNTELKALPVSEITFADLPAEFRPIMSYDAKWNPDSIEQRSFRRLCPAPLDAEDRQRVIATCEAAYKTVGLSGYGRVDVRWEEATGRLHVLDVNANPDITDGQGLPFTAAYDGLSYPELVQTIIDCALQRH